MKRHAIGRGIGWDLEGEIGGICDHILLYTCMKFSKNEEQLKKWTLSPKFSFCWDRRGSLHLMKELTPTFFDSLMQFCSGHQAPVCWGTFWEHHKEQVTTLTMHLWHLFLYKCLLAPTQWEGSEEHSSVSIVAEQCLSHPEWGQSRNFYLFKTKKQKTGIRTRGVGGWWR